MDGFRRITRDGRWIPEIDGLRFVAITAVVLFHLAGELVHRSGRLVPIEPQYGWLGRVLGNGDRGVWLFFVISGMILALPYARHFLGEAKAPSLRKYYLRRITRLEPPYVLAMLLAAGLIVGYVGRIPAGFGRHLLASLLYQHGLIYGELSPVNMVTWSLEVEIQFYVLAPLFMQVFRIRGRGCRRGSMLAAIAVIGVLQAPYALLPHVYMSLLFYVQYFLTGLLVADVFVLDLGSIQHSAVWDVAGVGALGLLAWAPHDVYWPHAVLPVACGTLLVAAMRGVALRRCLANRWVAVTGGMCYSIYLLHDIFISVLFKVTRRAIVPGVTFPVNYAIQLCVTALPAGLLCAIFFRLVERPCMDPDWPSKLWHGVTGRPRREVEALDSAGMAD